MVAGSKVWADMQEDEAAIELNLRGASWSINGKSRTLIYNLNVPTVRNNIDICLFNCSADQMSNEIRKTASSYLALGELKGGIDPAGADEHWKTARTALGRIHTSFAEHGLKPKTFFIGAAVEAKMASEIWGMLAKGELDNAANLTNDGQLASITQWLCSL
jgi:type II restriction enzyme